MNKIKQWVLNLSAVDISLFLAALALLLYLAPMVLISRYNQPFHDDFCFAMLYQQNGFWGSLSYLYHTQLGRFSSNTLLILFGSLGGNFGRWLFVVKILPVILLFVLFGALVFLMFALFKTTLNYRQQWTLAALAFVVYISVLTSVPEGVYWAASTLTHAFAVIMWLVIAALIILFRRSKTSPAKILTAVAATAVTIVAVGMDENTLGMMVLASLFVLIVALVRKWRAIWFYVLWALVTLVSSLAVFTAPGNWSRYGLYKVRLGFLVTVIASTYSTVTQIYKWINPTLILASVLSLPIFIIVARQKNGKGTHPLWAAFITFTLVDILTFISVFSTGVNPVPRVWDSIAFVFLAGWFVTWFCAVDYAIKRYHIDEGKWLAWFGIKDVALLFGLILVFLAVNGGNIKAVWEDLGRGRAKQYSAFLNQRYAYIQRQKSLGHKNLVIESLPVTPETLYVGDIENDPEGAGNICYVRYFGINSIRFK